MSSRVNYQRGSTVVCENKNQSENSSSTWKENIPWTNECCENTNGYDSYRYQFTNNVSIKSPSNKQSHIGWKISLVEPYPNVHQKYSPPFRQRRATSPIRSQRRSNQFFSNYQELSRPRKFSYQNYRKPNMQQQKYGSVNRSDNRPDDLYLKNDAAVTIQSAFRGYRTRKEYWKQREQFRREKDEKFRMQSNVVPEETDDYESTVPTAVDPNLGILPPMDYFEDKIKDKILREIKAPNAFGDDIPSITQLEDNSYSTILLFGGINPRDAKNYLLQSAIFMYNTGTDKWYYAGAMPEPRCYHSAVLSQGKIYIIGGFDPLSLSAKREMLPTKSVYQFSVRAKRWRGRCDMLQNRAYHGSCAFGKNNIVVVGGQNEIGTILATVEMYNTEKDQWSFLKTLPIPLIGMAVTVLEGEVWVLGGITYKAKAKAFMASDQVYNFDFKNQTWKTRFVLPEPRGFCTALTTQHEIWLFGGVYDDLSPEGYLNSSESVFVYSPVLNKWVYPHCMQTPKHSSAIAKTVERKMYILGGMCSIRREALTENDVFDRNADGFYEGASLPRPLTGTAAVGLPPFHSNAGTPKYLPSAGGNIEDLAATKIQAAYRGHRTRANFREHDKYYSAEFGDDEPIIRRKHAYNQHGNARSSIDESWRKITTVSIHEWPPKPDPNSSLSTVNLQLGGELPGYTILHLDSSVQIKRYVSIDYDVDPNIGLVGFLDDLYKKTRKVLGLRRMDPLPCFAHLLRAADRLQEDSVHTIVLLGGLQPRDPLNYSFGKIVLKYHPLRDRWEYAGLLPEPRNHHAAVYFNKCIYVTGGCDVDKRNSGEMVASDATFCMEISKMDWKRKASMKCPRAFHSMVVYNGKFYVIGGRDNNGRLIASIEEFSPEINEWVTLRSMDQPRMGMACVVYRDSLWCLGGIGREMQDPETGPSSKLKVLNSVVSYNVENKIWEKNPPLRCPRAFATCVEIGGLLWLCAGCCRLPNEKFLVSMASIDCYNETEAVWERKTVISNPRHAAATTTIEDCIYMFGGISSQEWSAQLRNEMVIASDHSIHSCEELPVPLSGAAAVGIPPVMRALRAVSLACLIHNKLTT